MTTKLLISKFLNSIKIHRVVRPNNVMVGLLMVMVLSIVYKFMVDHKAGKHMSRDLAPYLRFPGGYVLPEVELNQAQVEHLAAKVEKLNNDAEIFNWEKLGFFKSDTTIIAVQVHKDVEQLQHLIISLAQVQHIQKVLLIFSHSYYDEHINRLVRSIKFAKVMQIFFPYSLQLNPGRFPGMDPGDCNDTARPERHDCNVRDARLTQHKHHWWWKVNFIFQGLDWSDTYKGIVIFLEENDYVLPDLLYMLSYARYALAHFPALNVVSFGGPQSQNVNYHLFKIDTWTPPFDRGLAFNRTTWQKIASLSSHFCFYDDCSWSYSLVPLFSKFPSGRAEMLGAVTPRVLPGQAGRRAWRGRAVEQLFPRPVRVVMGAERTKQKPCGRHGQGGHGGQGCQGGQSGRGGWADLRDQLLCLDPLVPSAWESATDTTFKNNKNEKRLNYYS